MRPSVFIKGEDIPAPHHGRRLSMLSQHGKPRHHKGNKGHKGHMGNKGHKGHMRHKGYSTYHQEAMKHVADTATTVGALKGAMLDSHHKAMKSHHKATHHQKAMKHVADTATTGSALKGAMVDSHHKAMEPHHKAVEKHIADTVAIALTHHAVSEDG
jgi:hypothetical protein